MSKNGEGRSITMAKELIFSGNIGKNFDNKVEISNDYLLNNLLGMIKNCKK